MAAELAEKRYTSALKKSLEAQNRIDSRSWLYDLDYYVRKYFVYFTAIFACGKS
jgi:hypothetical protein